MPCRNGALLLGIRHSPMGVSDSYDIKTRWVTNQPKLHLYKTHDVQPCWCLAVDLSLQ